MKKSMLQQYKTLVEFLGFVLGPDYEVALHDLSDMSSSLVAIANGHVSGREIGAPLTSLALKMITDKRYSDKAYHVNYNGITTEDKVLRSSSMYIRNETNKIVGMLCINFDDSRYQELSTKLFQLCHPDQFVEQHILIQNSDLPTEEENNDQPAPPELFSHSITSIMESVILDEIQKVGIPANRLTKEEKIRIIGLLEEKGVFLLKGAIPYVAKVLHSSPATIYRYLQKK